MKGQEFPLQSNFIDSGKQKDRIKSHVFIGNQPSTELHESSTKLASRLAEPTVGVIFIIQDTKMSIIDYNTTNFCVFFVN